MPKKEEPTPEGRQPSEVESTDAAEGAEKVAEDIEALLADVRRERDEYLDLAQRTKADFENYRKRIAGQAAETERRGAASLARELIPVLDNLERALEAAGLDPDLNRPDARGREAEHASGRDDLDRPDARGREAEHVPSGRDDPLASGVLLVHRELAATLGKAGIEPYDPVGEPFDPAWHEALTTRAEDGTESGVVLEVVEKGYRGNGQVLRPARVVVSE